MQQIDIQFHVCCRGKGTDRQLLNSLKKGFLPTKVPGTTVTLQCEKREEEDCNRAIAGKTATAASYNNPQSGIKDECL